MDELTLATRKINWLKAVGTGIRLGQMTLEAQQAVEAADVVLAAVVGDAARVMLKSYNPVFVDLTTCYARGKERRVIYHEMADRVMGALRSGKNVCFALYGHPLIFAYPTKVVLQTAREEGYEAVVLPGVSAEDMIFAELEIDPAKYGCQTYCATEFLTEERIWDPRSVLLLWQVSIIGESQYQPHGDAEMRRALADRLIAIYGEDHPAILYEASPHPFAGPAIQRVALAEFGQIQMRSCCTVAIPPFDHPGLIDVPMVSGEIEWVQWEEAKSP